MDSKSTSKFKKQNKKKKKKKQKLNVVPDHLPRSGPEHNSSAARWPKSPLPFWFKSLLFTRRGRLCCSFVVTACAVRDGSSWMVIHGGSRWLGASIARTSTASSKMAKSGEGVEGIQCSSAARASVWAKVGRSTSARSAVEWRSQWPLACGFRATASKSRCSTTGSARSRGQVATSSRSVGGHFTECKGFIVRAEKRVTSRDRSIYRARVTLPSPEDSVSEVMRLREVVSQLQAQIGQGPVLDVPCGPIVKRTCRSGQGVARFQTCLGWSLPS